MAGLEICPVNNPLVKSSLESAKRKLGRPVRPKKPLSLDTVQAIAEFYVSSNFLATLRFLFILLVGFYGFFRVAEINSFFLQDVTINADHMSIYVAKRKNDHYWEGHTSYLARFGKSIRAQFPLRDELLRFCRSLIHCIRLFVVLLSPNPASISTLARACLFPLLERNSRSTPSPLLTTFQSTAGIV